MARKTRANVHDEIWAKIKSNRFLAILIVSGTIIVSLISFSETLLGFIRNISGFLENGQEINIIKTGSIFGLSDRSESDIINVSNNGITVDFSMLNSHQTDSAGEFDYVLRSDRGKISISPYSKYLNLIQAGGPISPSVPFYSPFDDILPTIDFKVVNNSSETIFFTKAIFQVSESKPDLFPVLEIDGLGYRCIFRLQNIGWGKVYNCKVAFNLIPTTYETDLAWDSSYFYFPWQSSSPYLGDYKVPYKHQILLGDFDVSGNVNMTKYLINEGVEMPEQDYFNPEGIKSYGPFRNGVAKMYGEITYEGIDFTGTRSKSKLHFESDIVLGYPGNGSAIQISDTYGVALEPDATNYIRVVPLSQSLKTGESDRFSLTLSAPKSSRHKFDLILVYNDNKKIAIRNLNLNCFISRVHAEKLAPSDPMTIELSR